jgi:hypothetical protein
LYSPDLDLRELRVKYGRVYVTILPDRLVVPWRPLPISSFLDYLNDIGSARYDQFALENEIFESCVIDETLVRHIPFLKSGTITTTVQNIWEVSGPASVDAFNVQLAEARAELSGPNGALHESVSIITSAFPYKPEEVYAMPADEMFSRLALAEKKLMQAGIMEEPLFMQPPREAQLPGTPVDAKKIFDQQQQPQPPQPPPQQRPATAPSADPLQGVDKREGKWWDVSPVLETKADHGIDFSTESQEYMNFAMSGHERQDIGIEQRQLLERFVDIYPELAKRVVSGDNDQDAES